MKIFVLTPSESCQDSCNQCRPPRLTHADRSLVRVILSLNEQVGFCRERCVLAQTYTAYSLALSVPDKMHYLYKNKCLETFEESIVCNSLETVRKERRER